MDITLMFKACIKTVRTMNKCVSNAKEESMEGKQTILRRNKRDPNLRGPRDIVKQITNFEQFFNDNRTAYMNVVNYLSTKKTMSESERMAIDAEANKIITQCSSMINDYRKSVSKLKLDAQPLEHYSNVINTVEDYLRAVSRMYAETKAIRVKKVIDISKISKLEMVGRETIAIPKNDASSQEDCNKQLLDDLSTEEMQMFEAENEVLYNQLNSLSQEVKAMESKIVHIAELQDQFTHNVLEQEKDIDRIANIVQATTDDMRDANEQIRQAIQRNAGLRVWVLFFLLVMSFSLIFLDWYND